MPLNLGLDDPAKLRSYLDANVPPDKKVVLAVGGETSADHHAKVSAQIGVRTAKGWEFGGQVWIDKPPATVGVPAKGVDWGVSGGARFVF